MGINYAAIIATLGITATVAVIIVTSQNASKVSVETIIEKPLPANCSNGQPKHTNLADSTSPVLQKLSDYEAVCDGATADQLMVFAPMPATPDEAESFAKTTATELKEFAKHEIPPLVVFEPSLKIPNILKIISKGNHDEALAEYYVSLKKEGVSDKIMGTWVLFPEANTPSWNTTSPEDFTKNVAKVAKLQKAAFPSSKTTLLLNSTSYPDNDTDWMKGEQKSLLPYLKDLPKGLIDSFGYQGFPYAPPANTGQAKQLDPGQFLKADLAIEAASALNVKSIWLNTGSFKTMHAANPAEQVTLSSEERDAILKGVIKQMQLIQARDMSVMVNLFAEDKSHVDEAVDWSYWKPGQHASSTDTKTFNTFVRRLRANNASFSLYDSAR